MSASRGNAKETVVSNSGSAIFAPFEAWAGWIRSNMGNMSAPPGFTGEEAGAVPEGATASNPLVSGMGICRTTP